MMKKVTVFAAFAAIISTQAAADEPVFASWPPASDFYNTDALPATIERINEGTDGKIQWNLIAGGQLATPRGSLSQLGDDLFQGGLVIPPYNPKAMPSLTLMYSVVMPGNDPVAHVGAAAETIFQHCPQCLEETRDNNIVPLGLFATSAYRLMCASPVSSVSELAGKRVRATGGYGEMVAKAGGTPMSVTLTETVGLLQKGGLDCIMAAREWLKTFGYGEFVKKVTDVPLGTTGPGFGFAINRDTFTAFSPSEQKAHLRATSYFTAKHVIENFVLKDEATFQQQVKDQGVSYVEPSDDLKQLVAAFPEDYRPTLVERGNSLGVADPEALLETYYTSFEKWRDLSAKVGTDVDAFADVLWEEVFSKIDPSTL